MEIFRHCLLVGCIFTWTVVYGSEDALQRRTIPSLNEYRGDAEAAEDHEHHRIIIVVPKEMPHHVNHVHTYKLTGKIPLIHSGKVVHDHKHNGKVKHDHGHVGKSLHSHKHAGAYGHQHKHVGHAAHKHLGHLHLVVGGKGKGGHAHRIRLHPHAHLRAPVDHRPLLRNAAHQLHQQQQQQHHHAGVGGGVDYRVQQHGPGGGTSGVLGPVPGSVGRGPVSGQVHYVPSSRPHGLGSFIPHEIQQYVNHDGRNGGGTAVHHLHRAQQYVPQHLDVDEDEGDARAGRPPGYNVIHLRVPEQGAGVPEVIKHVDIDLTNNVAKLQAGGKVQNPAVTANYKSVTQYNKVIGHGRAVPPSAEEEFDAQSADEEDGEGGELLLEDVGYRFGEGYRLALDSGGDGGGGGGGGDGGGGGGSGGEGGDGADEFSAAQEQDEEELDEYSKEPSINAEFVDPTDGQAYSQTYTMQY